MRPPVQRARSRSSWSFQPAGGVAEASSMPGGAFTSSEIVAWGGRSFGSSKDTVDLTSPSTNGGVMVTCASARDAATRLHAAVRRTTAAHERGIRRGAPFGLSMDAMASAGGRAMVEDSPTGLQPEVLGDHHPLHLVRALADLEDLLVAVEAGDRKLVHEAVTAVDLESLVDDAVRELAGVELRHRRLERERAASVLEPCRLEDELASRLDLDRHVGELERDGLELADRPPELLPLLCVCVGEVVRALREPDAHRRDGDAPTVEDLEKLVEALAARPEQVP